MQKDSEDKCLRVFPSMVKTERWCFFYFFAGIVQNLPKTCLKDGSHCVNLTAAFRLSIVKTACQISKNRNARSLHMFTCITLYFLSADSTWTSLCVEQSQGCRRTFTFSVLLCFDFDFVLV